MKLRNIIYSLRNIGNEVVLSIDLTHKILSEESHEIIIDLPTGVSHIRKSEYLNKMKIYHVDDKLFFLICDKKVSRQFIFETLMKHAIDKVENRINYLDNQIEGLDSRKNTLQNLKSSYQKMLKVA
jgi:hypothetical protein